MVKYTVDRLSGGYCAWNIYVNADKKSFVCDFVLNNVMRYLFLCIFVSNFIIWGFNNYLMAANQLIF